MWCCLLMLPFILLPIIPQQPASAHRLNVPRALLPYHPQHQARFLLEVSDPDGGCFLWRSSRPDIVSVEQVDSPRQKPIGSPLASTTTSAGPPNCSATAFITVRSRHPEQQSAVIHAEEVLSHSHGPQSTIAQVLSCEVTVDPVRSISIQTTTKVLYVDAAPAEMVVEALNSDGDRFSTLGAIPFEWQLESVEDDENDGEELNKQSSSSAQSIARPLRILPFAQSKYNPPEEGIEQLERERRKGYVVLVEGLQTGSVRLRASFADTYYSTAAAKLAPAAIDLYVVTNIMLVPSEDLYLAPNARVPYRAVILRKTGTVPIALPTSPQYSLRVGDEAIVALDSTTATVTAMQLGRTELTLIDADAKPKAGVKPPQAYLEVVEPDSLQFTVDKGGAWYLQLGELYTIGVRVEDAKGNDLHITENARFTTMLPSKFFTIVEQSPNQTYFRVRASDLGKTQLTSTFHSHKDAKGNTIALRSPVSGEQEVEINPPLAVEPTLLVFPPSPSQQRDSGSGWYNYRLKTSGGSGHYLFHSSDPTVAEVGENDGHIVVGRKVGEATVRVQDQHNPMHSAETRVLIAEPTQLIFAPSPVEARVGQELRLRLAMLAENGAAEKVPLTDCSKLPFKFSLRDEGVYQLVEAAVTNKQVAQLEAGEPTSAPSCAFVVLKAMREGDTELRIELPSIYHGEKPLSAIVHISAYEPLKLSLSHDLLLAPGASIALQYDGGPRPWALERQNYFANVTAEDASLVKVGKSEEDGGEFQLQCVSATKEKMTHVTLSVGNQPSAANSHPAIETIHMTVCCSMPEHLLLRVKRPEPPRDMAGLSSCPMQSSSIHSRLRTNLELRAEGTCYTQTKGGVRTFDSINSLLVDYSLQREGAKLASIKAKAGSAASPDESEAILLSTIVPQGKRGRIEVLATLVGLQSPKKTLSLPKAKRLQSSLALELVDSARIHPETPQQLLIWARSGRLRNLEIYGGSGEFWLPPLLGNATDAGHATTDSNAQPIDVKLVRATPGRSDVGPSAKVELISKKEGSVRLSIYDLCLASDERDQPAALSLNVKVADLHSLCISGEEYLALGSTAELKVRLLDETGQLEFTSPDIEAMQVEVKAVVADGGNRDVIKLTPVKREGLMTLRYQMEGLRMGLAKVVATAKSASRDEIRSQTPDIQVFPPMGLRPKTITLLTESYFQLELIGGPQPRPEVRFEVEHTDVASVAPNGLIRSGVKSGKTAVRAVCYVGARVIAEDTSIINVAPLAAVNIYASTQEVERGQTFSTRTKGLFSSTLSNGSDETMFSIAGAIHPLSVVWRLKPDDGTVVAVGQQSASGLAMEWLAQKPGRVEIGVEVRANSAAQLHLGKAHKVLTDSITLEVHAESLRLGGGSLAVWTPKSIVMGPNSRLALAGQAGSLTGITYRRETTLGEKFEFTVHPSSTPLLGIGAGGLKEEFGGNRSAATGRTDQLFLQSGDSEGTGTLIVTRLPEGSNLLLKKNKRISAIQVDVMSMESIHLHIHLPHSLYPTNQVGHPDHLPVLPQGMWIRVEAEFRDAVGRPFHAANTRLSYRANRFDLVEIVPDDGYSAGGESEGSAHSWNFKIHLKEAGETVLRVWDERMHLASYVTLKAGDVLLPAEKRNFFVGELACFSSPFASAGGAETTTKVVPSSWRATGGSEGGLAAVELLALAHETGVAVVVMREKGKATLYTDYGSAGATYAELTVSPIAQVRFHSDSPKFVSNLPGEEYVFPIQIDSESASPSKEAKGQTSGGSGNLHNCGEEVVNLLAASTDLVQARILSPSDSFLDCKLKLLTDSKFDDANGTLSAITAAVHNAFSVRAVFRLSEGGSYACVVKAQEGYQVSSPTITEMLASLAEVTPAGDTASIRLSIEASVLGHSKMGGLTVDNLKVDFHPRFTIHNDEILLNNVKESREATLAVTVMPKLVGYLRVEGCHQGILDIQGPSAAKKGKGERKDGTGKEQLEGGNYEYTIKLNINKAALWPSQAENCRLTLRSTLTSQTVTIPVRIKLYGDVAQAAINALKYGGVLGALTAVFEAYQTLALSSVVILACTVGFIAGYQRGLFYPLMGPSPQATSSALLNATTSSLASGSFAAAERRGGGNLKNGARMSPPSWLYDGHSPQFHSTPTSLEEEQETPLNGRLFTRQPASRFQASPNGTAAETRLAGNTSLLQKSFKKERGSGPFQDNSEDSFAAKSSHYPLSEDPFGWSEQSIRDKKRRSGQMINRHYN